MRKIAINQIIQLFAVMRLKMHDFFMLITTFLVKVSLHLAKILRPTLINSIVGNIYIAEFSHEPPKRLKVC